MSLNNIVEVIGRGIPVPGDNINTDIIIPARFLKEVTFEPLGEYAFEDIRYEHDEQGNRTQPKEHPFNEERYQGASVLFVNKNFGCGSSREHAPQALMRWGRKEGYPGIQAIVAESFAEIFEANCRALGIIAAAVGEQVMSYFMQVLSASPGIEYTLNLRDQHISFYDQDVRRDFKFQIPESTRKALLEDNWDSTNMLLADEAAIEETRGKLPYMKWFSTRTSV